MRKRGEGKGVTKDGLTWNFACALRWPLREEGRWVVRKARAVMLVGGGVGVEEGYMI